MGTQRPLKTRNNIPTRQGVDIITNSACLLQVFARIAQLRGWRQAAKYLDKRGKNWNGEDPYFILWEGPYTSSCRIDVAKHWLRLKHTRNLPNFAKAKVEVLTKQHL